MCCFVDPLSIRCKHVTVARFLRRGRGRVCKHALQAACSYTGPGTLGCLLGAVPAVAPGTSPRRAVCTQCLSQELAPLASACWKRLQEGWAQQELSGHKDGFPWKMSGHKERLPMENVMLMLLVRQLHQTPEAQQLGPPWERPREHLQRHGHRFSTRHCHSHPARGSGCGTHQAAGTKPKRLLWQSDHPPGQLGTGIIKTVESLCTGSLCTDD